MPVPVILLTARGELNERLEGLNLGADDYLTKPFYIEELIARLHVVTRRASGASQSILAVADLTINLLTREVTRGGTENRPDGPRVRTAGTLRPIAGPGADAPTDLRAGVEL